MFELGRVTGDSLNISINAEPVVTALVEDLETAWSDSLKNKLEN